MTAKDLGPSAPVRPAPVPWWSYLFHQALDHASWFVFLILIIFATLAVFSLLLRKGWGFGFVLVPIYGLAIYGGIRDLAERRLSARQAVGAITLMTVLSVAIAAAVSEMLQRAGAATYAATDPAEEPVRFELLLGFYLWTFLDLLPALEVTKSLGLPSPVKLEGWVAGLPIVAFRGFIVLVLLKVIKDWWTGRDGRAVPSTATTTTPVAVGAPTAVTPRP